MTQVQGSKYLYTAGAYRKAYLPDGRSPGVVVTTDDGSIAVLTLDDHRYGARSETLA